MTLIDTRYGRMQVIDADSVVSASLRAYGEWAQDEIEIFAALCKPEWRVLDIGAFIGTHSLAFSKILRDKGAVYSFEPRKEIYEVLVKNLELNSCKNVHALNMGVAEKTVTISLQKLDLSSAVNFGGLSFEYAQTRNDNSNTYEIAVSSLDSLDLGRIDFIKIDVEGMECRVLEGAVKLIAQNRPVIFTECNSLQAGSSLFEFCNASGYSMFAFLSSPYRVDNFNDYSENIFGGGKELGLLLVCNNIIPDTLSRLGSLSFIQVKNLDDLCLLMLHKPQYFYEVLNYSPVVDRFGVDFSSPRSEKAEKQISLLDEALAYARQIIDERSKETDALHQQLKLTFEAKENAEHLAFSRLEELQSYQSKIAALQVELAAAQENQLANNQSHLELQAKQEEEKSAGRPEYRRMFLNFLSKDRK